MTFRPCFVVPVFNHGAGLVALADRLAAHGLPLFVVDDGSDGETEAMLDAVARRQEQVRLLRLPFNGGKGRAVIAGLRAAWAAGCSHALQIDADGQHDVTDVSRFLAAAAGQPAAVIAGIPVYDDSVPTVRRLARYLTHAWVWIETLSFDIRDSMCGYRVYPLAATMDLVDRVTLGRRMDFDTEILVRLHWQGVPVVSLPTRVTYPAGGRSNFRLWRDNALITRMHTRLVFGMLWRAPGILRRRLGCSSASSLDGRAVRP